MRKGSLLLFLSVFLIAIVMKLASSAVYINEIELNPDGTDSGMEWIELYNDGPSQNLNDWYLQNKDGQNYSLSGNTINIIFFLDFLSNLDNVNQEIKLFDNNGILRDSSTTIDDEENDFRSWSRMPDGTGSFVFQDSTKGIPNEPPHISNKDSSPSCITSGANVSLSVEVSGICVEDVIFSVNINGNWLNYSGIFVSGNEYRVAIPSNILPNSQNIFWTVFVKDCFDSTFQDGTESFYVNSKTILSISPSNPDGLNSWYISKPFFTLTNDDAANIYYQWDSDDIFTYSGAFSLEDTPNNGNVTGGILELNYWSDVCSEVHIRKIIKTDFSAPSIKDPEPAENSLVVNNPRPLISAFLDELYQSNSGIDKHDTTMFIDGIEVNPKIEDVGSIDAEISYILNSDLSPGQHEIRVDAYDQAGRNSVKIWYFDISLNESIDFNVFYPINKIYNTKKIPFNITSSEVLSSIEYYNFNEKSPKWRSLCKNCEEFGFSKKKEKNLLEGENNITIKGISKYGQNSEKNILLFIESKQPKIIKFFPNKGFTNGNFWIEFFEDNPELLTLSYGNAQTGNRIKTFNLTDCIVDDDNTICEDLIELEDYHQQEIEYYFTIRDIANNTASTKTKFLLVDTVPPLVNEFEFTTDGSRVLFNILVEENNFKKASYIDHNENTPRARTLCTKLNEDSFCTKKISFPIGHHNLTISLEDKAGNKEILSDVNFDIV